MEENKMNSKMVSHYGDDKFSKEVELNASMTIDPSAPDEYENTLKSIGGK